MGWIIIADGDCIIDVDYVGFVGHTDVETYTRIWSVAESVIHDCAFMPSGTTYGGLAAGLGRIYPLWVTFLH